MLVSELVKKLGLKTDVDHGYYQGIDIEIKGVCGIERLTPDCLTFAKTREFYSRIRESQIRPLAVLVPHKEFSTAMMSTEYEPIREEITPIFSDEPRLDFVKASRLLISSIEVAQDLSFGSFPPTLTPSFVVIYPCVTMGGSVDVYPGTVIGKPGFGFARDHDGTLLRFPHIGGVVIGRNVEIGANTVIDRGGLGDTVIGEGTKIDNLVHIAHNVKIGKNCIIVADALLCGGCSVGDDSWIGGNATVKEHVKIGKNCLVGLGAVVTKDVPDNTTVLGNPAEPIDEWKKKEVSYSSR